MPDAALIPANTTDAVGNKVMRHLTYQDAQDPQVSILTACMTAGQALHRAIRDAMCQAVNHSFAFHWERIMFGPETDYASENKQYWQNDSFSNNEHPPECEGRSAEET
jgi:hypothetical protein